MRRPLPIIFGVFLFALTTGSGVFLHGWQPADGARQSLVASRRTSDASSHAAVAFGRSELYFGTLKPQGVVTDAEFEAFIDHHVTKRFPDGLTVLKGNGQFRGEDRIIRKETSYVLIVLYPDETRERSGRKLNEIREIYKDLFQQQSVLRVDDPFVVWVSF